MSEIPAIHYPAELPVSQRRDDIARAISENRVIIVAGATGSGKTTQLPKMLLELGYSSIAHTQPRRIAARTIAERVSEELGSELGGLVGYQVRFTDKAGPLTKIKLMTDGILLNQIHRDRDLTQYDAIIIDEAHERSLTVDFLLGYLKQLLERRPELKVVITSATIDPESFSKHFDGAPIIEVSGRTYPVEIRYRPLVAEAPLPEALEGSTTGSAPSSASGDENSDTSQDRDYLQGINDALDELARESDGDVLVFLSGENEIRDAEDAIRGRVSTGSTSKGGSTSVWGATEVLPLYGRLSAADQHKVFDARTPGIRRRIVLATNVAETSLTVPGIRYVIDAGTARISRYSARSKIQRLPIEAISQASANQRSGRSGRTSDGIAIRLYSEEDFRRRPEYTDPEILRTNLSSVILQMISLGLGDIEAFPFLQKPDSRGVKDGLDLLKELNAIDADGRITRVGKQLTQLPLDPRFARMVVESKAQGCTREVIAIVAGLSIQDPRERPLERRAQADQQHARFTDPTSDFLTLLNLWNYLQEKQRELSGNQFRRLVKAEYLNYLRVREWQDVYRQLTRSAKQLGLHVGEPAVNGDAIHRSILSGLLSHIGLRDLAKKDYAGARGTRFTVFPGSALAKKQPAAIMSAELVETSRLFARMNAAIDPAWAEPLAGALVKRSHSEPHWEKRQGAVVAYEKVTLYGVPIIPKRRVQFSRIDLSYARDLFIRHALVEGDVPFEVLRGRTWGFMKANGELRTRLAEVEERTRRRDILVDDEAIVEFYDRRLPRDVASVRDFEGWWKKARVDQPDLLLMREDDLLDPQSDTGALDGGFPATWSQGDQTLALSYRFEPGASDDGVTVTVPLPLLAGLTGDGFDWQVPGLREELVTALIKALPKHIRKNVVPAADWARRLLAEAPVATTASITEFLSREIQSQTHTPVTPADFDWDRVPDHLRMTFAVADARGKVIQRGKSLSALQVALRPAARESVAKVVGASGSRGGGPDAGPVRDTLERSGITAWDFGDLDRVRDTKHGGNTMRAYPALTDGVASVSIRLQATPGDQAIAHRRGVLRLLVLATPSPLGYVQEHLTGPEKLALAASPYRSIAALFEDCLVACIESIVEPGQIYTAAEFESARSAVSAAIMDLLFDAVGLVSRVLSAAREADKAIRDATTMTLIAPLGDARSQLEALVHPDFVSRAGLARLRRYPLYLQGITHRVAKLVENPGRDRAWMHEVQQATAKYIEAGGALPLAPDSSPTLVRVRWMLEELRLSLFAQHLGTDGPVSTQRISKALAG